MEKNISFILLDSNGICLIPPNNEFEIKNVNDVKIQNINFPSEQVKENGNLGFDFNKLLALSHRDSLLKHISNSVVPLSLDDDVLFYTDNYAQYSIISEIDCKM